MISFALCLCVSNSVAHECRASADADQTAEARGPPEFRILAGPKLTGSGPGSAVGERNTVVERAVSSTSASEVKRCEAGLAKPAECLPERDRFVRRDARDREATHRLHALRTRDLDELVSMTAPTSRAAGTARIALHVTEQPSGTVVCRGVYEPVLKPETGSTDSRYADIHLSHLIKDAAVHPVCAAGGPALCKSVEWRIGPPAPPPPPPTEPPPPAPKKKAKTRRT